jgi:hypothetical protein
MRRTAGSRTPSGRSLPRTRLQCRRTWLSGHGQPCRRRSRRPASSAITTGGGGGLRGGSPAEQRWPPNLLKTRAPRGSLKTLKTTIARTIARRAFLSKSAANAAVSQDLGLVYETEGHRFESCRARYSPACQERARAPRSYICSRDGGSGAFLKGTNGLRQGAVPRVRRARLHPDRKGGPCPWR